MSVGPWHAWFSQKALKTCDHLNVYADADGNEYLCTLVTVLDKHNTGWDDMVHLGEVVKHVRFIKKDLAGTYSIPGNVRTTPLKSKPNTIVTKAVNDYVCPACDNNKCSKTEKSCWKCGFQFNKS